MIMKFFNSFWIFVFSMILIMACSDTKSEDEYYKLAYDQYNSGKYEESIINFESVLKHYPEGEKSAKSMFMIGFIYANHTKNLDKAKEYYNKFIEKYPEHELASSAKYELDTLGKDINELDIFKNIEEESKVDTK